ncbi:MAG: hypothetical protein U9R05_00995 [Chloroflexota bacterium]|nr:hypothetical protein [Chloroflexota bacterium]
MLITPTPVIEFADALKLHTAQAFPKPAVQTVKLTFDSTERSGEVMGKPQDNPIESSDGLLVEVMGANGQLADFVFEFLHGFGADGDTPGGD